MNTLERPDAWLPLPEEERMLRASVQTLASTQIAPRAEHCDRAAEFPWDHVQAINALGLNAMFIPEAYGGVPDLAMRVATDAVQLYGGYGYCKDYRVERLLRDAKITQIWEGTNQIHRQLIGRSFMRKGGAE